MAKGLDINNKLKQSLIQAREAYITLRTCTAQQHLIDLRWRGAAKEGPTRKKKRAQLLTALEKATDKAAGEFKRIIERAIAKAKV